MGKKLYGKGITPACVYCKNGEKSEDGTLIFCMKKGILPPDYSCRKFKYDPLERIPKEPLRLGEYSKEEFEL